MPDSSVLLGELTCKELEGSLSSGVVKGVIVPLGSCEQHREHLPMLLDTVCVTEIARRVALQFRPSLLVAPTIPASVSEHHMARGGALTIRPQVLMEYVYDVCHSLKRLGVPKVMVLNGHGGNKKPKMEEAAPETMRRLDTLGVTYLTYWEACPRSFFKSHLEVDRSAGHAGEFETSLALACFPERVRLDQMSEEGAKLATVAKGGEILAAMVEAVAQRVQQMLDAP